MREVNRVRVHVWAMGVWCVLGMIGICLGGNLAHTPDLDWSEADSRDLSPGLDRYPPEITKSHITSFARWCELSVEQREAALSLYSAYIEAHEAAANKMYEYWDAITEGGSTRLLVNEKISKAVEHVRQKFLSHAHRLRIDLIEDLKALTTAEQAPTWAWIERRLRETDLLSNVESPSHRWPPDLVLVLERVLPADSTPEGIRELLGNHVAELHALVREGERGGESEREQMKDVWVDPALTREQKQERYREARAWRKPISAKAFKSVVDTIDRMRRHLPPEIALHLEAAAYRTGSDESSVEWLTKDFEVLIARVLRLGDLTAEQRQAIHAARAQLHRREVELLRGAFECNLDPDTQCDGNERERRWKYLEDALAPVASAFKAVREALTPAQREAFGPPLSDSKVSIPDFESEEEPPLPHAWDQREQAREHRTIVEWITVQTELSEADVHLVVRSALLDRDQRRAAAELHADYLARSRLARRRISAFQSALWREELSGVSRPETFKREIEAWLRYERHRDAIRESFVGDLEALLTDEQRGAIDVLKDVAARRKAFGDDSYGFSALEHVDLSALVRASLGAQEPSDEIVAELVAFEKSMRDLSDTIVRAKGETNHTLARWASEADIERDQLFDAITALQPSFERWRLDSKLRARAAFKRIVPLLDEGARALFELSFYRSQLYDWREWDGSSLRTAEGLAPELEAMKDLSEEQKAALGAARLNHMRAATSACKASYESQFPEEHSEPGAEPLRPEHAPHSINFTLRRLDEAAIEEMIRVLTPEQRERLSKPYRPADELAPPVFDDQ